MIFRVCCSVSLMKKMTYFALRGARRVGKPLSLRHGDTLQINRVNNHQVDGIFKQTRMSMSKRTQK